jgi:hypothetical protein
MPLNIAAGQPTLLIRRDAFERAGLTRAALDERLGLTPDEFRVEGSLIAVGPIVGETALDDLITELESRGRAHNHHILYQSGNRPHRVRQVAGGG